MRRIVLSVTNDLVTDQRVHRACTALHEEGYKVTLIGRMLPESGAVKRDYSTVRMKLLFKKKAIFYAEYNIRLFLKLMFVRTDAFYANDTDTLVANYLASRIRHKPMFFDAHEMFPEVPELVGRDRVKRFWTRIEDFIFPKIARRDDMAAVTVCQSIAEIYKQRYGLEMAVVRNVPMSYNNTTIMQQEPLLTIPEGKKILLYQGAVNIGRGIEWVMDVMPQLPDCHLVIAGVGDIYDALVEKKQKDGTENITFLGRVAPDKLHSLTPKASLGLSLLENRGLNYYYSLPNRIADFVAARVPVLATDFPEIHRVVEKYGIGTLVPDGCKDLAAKIRESLSYWEALPEDEREARFCCAAKDLSWENDKKILLCKVDTIFS